MKVINKKLLILSAILCMSTSQIIFAATDKVVYGEDNRTEPWEWEGDLLGEWSRSVAAQIDNKAMKEISVEKKFVSVVGLEHTKFMEKYRGIPLCEHEPFAEQNVRSTCTAFLVAPDVLITAGHCVESQKECEENSWVFDFKVDANGSEDGKFHKNNVYKCEKLLSQHFGAKFDLGVGRRWDYAVIKLKRAVTDRKPLKMNLEGTEAGTELVLMGHPDGLPLKIAEGAEVLKNDHLDYFVTNTDSYRGNSGSPVINAETGVVEGILVSGETDFTFNSEGKCLESKVCDKDLESCKGEKAHRLSMIPELKELLKAN